MEEQSNWEYWKGELKTTAPDILEAVHGIYSFVITLVLLIGLIASFKFLWSLL